MRSTRPTPHTPCCNDAALASAGDGEASFASPAEDADSDSTAASRFTSLRPNSQAAGAHLTTRLSAAHSEGKRRAAAASPPVLQSLMRPTEGSWALADALPILCAFGRPPLPCSCRPSCAVHTLACLCHAAAIVPLTHRHGRHRRRHESLQQQQPSAHHTLHAAARCVAVGPRWQKLAARRSGQ